MFGAADPGQAISQLEAYYHEGRGERVEVMASALVDQLMAVKSRSDEVQEILVRALRILSAVLNSRGKYLQARSTISLLHKHRKKYFKSSGNYDSNLAASDYHLGGFIHANANKKSAAKKSFAKCEKLQPGHLAAALDVAEQCGYSKQLAKLYPSAGPVTSLNGSYVLQIGSNPPADARRVGNILGGETQRKIELEITEIMSQEQAADARMKAAVDSLVPTHDYHSYSTN